MVVSAHFPVPRRNESISEKWSFNRELNTKVPPEGPLGRRRALHCLSMSWWVSEVKSGCTLFFPADSLLSSRVRCGALEDPGLSGVTFLPREPAPRIETHRSPFRRGGGPETTLRLDPTLPVPPFRARRKVRPLPGEPKVPKWSNEELTQKSTFRGPVRVCRSKGTPTVWMGLGSTLSV